MIQQLKAEYRKGMYNGNKHISKILLEVNST